MTANKKYLKIPYHTNWEYQEVMSKLSEMNVDGFNDKKWNGTYQHYNEEHNFFFCLGEDVFVAIEEEKEWRLKQSFKKIDEIASSEFWQALNQRSSMREEAGPFLHKRNQGPTH